MELEPLASVKCDLVEVKQHKSVNKKTVHDRGIWPNRCEFLLALVGYTVGIGSIWRFPQYCGRNGGGAFLIPFFFFMITCGGPLYYLEVSLGQFTAKSAGIAFECCPLFKEQLSVATAAVSSMTVTNQSSISFQINETLGATLNATTKNISPATEFWLYAETLSIVLLQMSVFFCSKVVYVTATAPYLLLTVLFIRGLLLDGAIDGIIWYITPDFNKLADPQVWLEAAIQVFYSLGPTYGGVITMASHNKFHQKSIEAGVSVEEAAKASGPGLAFIAYPEAIARMPLPQLWAVLFFLMLITVAFDSTFGMFETVTGTILDIFPHQLMNRKVPVLIGTALVLFLLSIPLAMSLAFIVTLFTYSEPYYGNYKFKPYAIIIGLCMSIVPFIPVIGVAMIERLSKLLKPSPKWGPIDENAREMYTAKPYRYEDTLFKRIKMNILGDKGTPWI
ncbi:SC6A1-like protein [Mya arenaria]|uniref:SC6A1-like protein n=1 Tax=Mya arenaria TaxID=6604 RepID=A0ABY7DNP4_MYAAR|nr:SC6A1-like protein [Mya arenaria]